MIFSPSSWPFTEWMPPRGRMSADAIASVIGVTAADIRRFRYFYNRDAIQAETWNRRRFVVSGLDVYRRSTR